MRRGSGAPDATTALCAHPKGGRLLQPSAPPARPRPDPSRALAPAQPPTGAPAPPTPCLLAPDAPSPAAVAANVVEHVKSTKQLPARFLMKLLPVEATCFVSMDDIKKLATSFVPEHFPEGGFGWGGFGAGVKGLAGGCHVGFASVHSAKKLAACLMPLQHLAAANG